MGHGRRRDQVAAAGDDDCRPVEVGHRIDEIERLGLEFHCTGSKLAKCDGRVQRLPVGDGGVVEFAVPDPAHEVGFVAVGRLAVEQESGALAQRRPQPAAPGEQEVELTPQHRGSREAVHRRGQLCGLRGQHALADELAHLGRQGSRLRGVAVPQQPAGRLTDVVDVAGRQHG